MSDLVASRNDRAAVLSRTDGRSPMPLDDGRFPGTSYRRLSSSSSPVVLVVVLFLVLGRSVSTRDLPLTRSRATNDSDCRSYRSRARYPSHRCWLVPSPLRSPPPQPSPTMRSRRWSITGVLSLHSALISPSTHYTQRPSGYHHHHHYRRRRRRRLPPRPPRRRRPVVAAPSSSLSTVVVALTRSETDGGRREERRIANPRDNGTARAATMAMSEKWRRCLLLPDVRLALSRAVPSLLFR